MFTTSNRIETITKVHKEEMNTLQQAASLLPPRGLRIMEAARYAGVSTWFIRQAVWEGRLEARRCGKFVIILRDDLDRFLENLPTVAPSSAEWLTQRRSAA
jgi:excisionase family DNA binding protein